MNDEMNDVMNNVTIKTYQVDDIIPRPWSGGKTRELAIFPEGASYPERDFIWRLSSADIELEESDFTALPDYDRTLMVLSGELVMSYDGKRSVRLKELEQDSFDGGCAVKSFGKVTDYNLMVRKGNTGILESLQLSEERTDYKIPESFLNERSNAVSDCYYCHKGYAVISAGDETVMLREGSQLVITRPAALSIRVGIMGSGVTVRALIAFLDETLEEMEEEIPAAGVSAEDVKAAYLIAFSNFRGSRHLFRSLKNIWYDKALQKGINRLERAYIPMILYIAGLFAAVYWAGNTWGQDKIGWAMLLWTLLDVGILTPALFLLVLPKPIRKHMKCIDALSPAERRIYEAEKDKNPRIEKVLKRYRITGRNCGDEFKGRDYKSFK